MQRLSFRPVFTLAALLCASPAAPVLAASGKCTIGKFSELLVTMVGLRAVTTANVNGADIKLAVDSGAFYSSVTDAAASELKLKGYSSNFIGMAGIGRSRVETQIASVKSLTLPGLHLKDISFLVGGSDVGGGAMGLLGQNILHIADVEYDLAGGAVRLFEARDCGQQPLAYWAHGPTPYSVMDVVPVAEVQAWSAGSHLGTRLPGWMYTNVGTAYVNGTRIRVMFDSGSMTSFISSSAAARVGVRTDSPGVIYLGEIHGVGRAQLASYLARFDSFKIGQEEIHNARLRIADIDLPNADMLVGADFFLSHRIYVANSQHKVYFTYNGGPVFDLSASAKPKAGADAPPDAGNGSNAGSRGADIGGGGDADAAEYTRRGEALEARNQMDQALEALNRACELAPDNPEYLHRRGMIFRQMGQPNRAMADFDRAVELSPGDLSGRLSRAALRLQIGDPTTARADLDAADASAPAQASERLVMAELYARADVPDSAITQLNLWVQAHPDDASLPAALNQRCWLRATRDIDLPLALKDCNTAIGRLDKSNPRYAAVEDSRGLVLLRMGEYDKAMAAYDLSLKINPKNALSWYGRGIARLRAHRAAEGNADIAQATTLWPQVADRFAHWGLVP